jgi:hypothetical protein
MRIVAPQCEARQYTLRDIRSDAGPNEAARLAHLSGRPRTAKFKPEERPPQWPSSSYSVFAVRALPQHGTAAL